MLCYAQKEAFSISRVFYNFVVLDIISDNVWYNVANYWNSNYKCKYRFFLLYNVQRIYRYSYHISALYLIVAKQFIMFKYMFLSLMSNI